MRHPNGKISCDREIGSPVKGWHRCGDTAKYAVTSQYDRCDPSELHYCYAHANAGQSRDDKLPGWRLIKVVPLNH